MDLQRLYETLPRFDCGACDAPTCRAFVRRILAGRALIDDCPILWRNEYAARRTQVSTELIQASQAANAGADRTGFPEGVTYIRPCAEDVTKVTVETRLQRRFSVPPPLKLEVYDPFSWDWMLESIWPSANVRFSESLGVARVEACNMTVMAFRDGRVNVRAARNEEQAMTAIHLLSRAFWGSVICRCGNTCMDCAAGTCAECLSEPCPALDVEPLSLPFSATQPEARLWNADESSIYRPILPGDIPALSEEVEQAARGVEELAACMACHMSRGNSQRLSGTLSAARKKTLQTLVRSPVGEPALSMWTTLGALADLQRANDSLNLIACAEQPLDTDVTDLLRDAAGVITAGGKRLRSGRHTEEKTAQERFETFREVWEEAFQGSGNVELLSAVYKLAANGFWLSRLRGLAEALS